MSLPEWQTAFDAYLANPRWPFLVGFALEARCIPVHAGWTHALGVRADGVVLSFDHDSGAGQPEWVTELKWIHVAIYSGMKEHPWMAAFLPSRPDDAVVCPSCQGTGRTPLGVETKMLCVCGGAGWVPASP